MQAKLVVVLAATAQAHGVLRSIEGDNGVTMPGMGVTDGTPRNCFSNTCGSQADTAIMRDAEMKTGKYGALGWNQGKGNIFPETVINTFMGHSNNIETNQGNSGSTGVEDSIPSSLTTSWGRMANHNRNVGMMMARDQDSGTFGNIFKSIANLPILGFGGIGGRPTNYPVEKLVADTAGNGATSGLPTPDENGILSLVWRQVNQDGAGPVSAAIDYESGATDYTAFQDARVTQQVPGLGLLGLSVATNTDYIFKVQTDMSKRCDGVIGNTTNVCVVRVRNGANAGPFGGCAAFTNRD
ncbi:hypothetical protein PWT90_05313 [Aphanocladium album]|nr:hypothetical protein PWT90_05313 [Aphanocladium album]